LNLLAFNFAQYPTINVPCDSREL